MKTNFQWFSFHASLFHRNKVLQISGGIEYPGGMRWELVACLVCAWILVYFAIWKSIKSSAKVICFLNKFYYRNFHKSLNCPFTNVTLKVRYVTATLPFVLIIIFLGRALTLDGAELGLRYFFQPKWELLGNANVWINAAAQNFNSLGIAFGSMISFASYNKYNNNFLHDTLAVSFVNAITSLLVGIFAFATIGNIALEQSTSVEDVISDGMYIRSWYYLSGKGTEIKNICRSWAHLRSISSSYGKNAYWTNVGRPIFLYVTLSRTKQSGKFCCIETYEHSKWFSYNCLHNCSLLSLRWLWHQFKMVFRTGLKINSSIMSCWY